MHTPPNSRALPTPGTPTYWRSSCEGFALLARLKAALRTALAPPKYVACGWDEDGEPDVIENLAPWERACELAEVAWSHPFAARVMAARGIIPSDTFQATLRRLP